MEKKFTLLIATSNPGKVREIEQAIRSLSFSFFIEIKTLKEFPHVSPPEETGKTFFENAFLKAKYYCEKTGLPCLADDSGLEVEALDGAPGVFSSVYAGKNASDEENNKKLLKNLEGIPLQKRKARFVCVMVLYHPSGKFLTTEGKWEGLIGFEPRGNLGFGYDPLFLVPEYNYQKTAAELSTEEKNKISHRGKALQKLVDLLPEFLKNLP